MTYALAVAGKSSVNTGVTHVPAKFTVMPLMGFAPIAVQALLFARLALVWKRPRAE